MWCEPVHCSLFFQYHHDTCTIAEPNHIYRTHFSFYAGTLIVALPQCVSRKLYRSSQSTSHGSSIECSPRPTRTGTARPPEGDIITSVRQPQPTITCGAAFAVVALLTSEPFRVAWRYSNLTHCQNWFKVYPIVGLPFLQTWRMLRVLIRSTSYSSLCFSNQSIATFYNNKYNCLVEIELHREIYHFTHERQTLKLDLNQHTRYTAVLPLNYWAINGFAFRG